jgi:hypothetical protein
MGGVRGVPLRRRDFVQRHRLVGEAITEPHDDDRDDQGSDGAVQVIGLILPRSAPLVRNDEAEGSRIRTSAAVIKCSVRAVTL